MKIAIVIPFLEKVMGNRLAFLLARELAKTNSVHVVTLVAHTDLIPKIPVLLGNAKLEMHSQTKVSHQPSNLTLLYRQLSRRFDRRLSRFLKSLHARLDFDAIVVMADEGHWLGGYVRRWDVKKRPITGVLVLDLIDHTFLLRRDRPHPTARILAGCAYPMMNLLERARLWEYDVIFSISNWTADNLEYLYGIRPNEVVPAVDTDLFKPTKSEISRHDARRVLVPTAGLDDRGAETCRFLAENGIPVVTVGPKDVSGVEHLGFVSDERLASLFGGSAVTFAPFDYEGLGLIPLESLACGTPVITYPKQGPYGELRDNKYVTFSEDPVTILRATRMHLDASRSENDIRECSQSILRYSPKVAAGAMLRALQGPLDKRLRVGATASSETKGSTHA